MSKVYRGWRYFECHWCGEKWRETCRDYSTESKSKCYHESCKANAMGGVAPFKGEPDASIKVDRFGNLLEEVVKERMSAGSISPACSKSLLQS